MVIESLGLYYHIECFRCFVCNIPLSSSFEGTDVRVRNHRLHCQNCFSDENGKRIFFAHRLRIIQRFPLGGWRSNVRKSHLLFVLVIRIRLFCIVLTCRRFLLTLDYITLCTGKTNHPDRLKAFFPRETNPL